MDDPPNTSQPLQNTKLAPKPFTPDDLLALVTCLSRFIYQLSRVPTFRNFGLGLAEWAALSLLSRNGSIDDQQLSVLLGLNQHRLRNLKSTLESAHLISTVASSTQPTKMTIVVTRRAKLYVEDVNAALMPALKEALQGRPNAASAFNKTMAALDEILKSSSEASEGTVKRQKKKKNSPISRPG